MADFAVRSNVTVPATTDEKPLIMIGDVAVKMLLREDPSEPVQVTDAPVEGGAEFSDYAIDLPMTLTLDIELFDDPAPTGSKLDDIERSGGTVSTWKEKKDRLLEYKRKKILVDISTGYDNYANMYLFDYTLDRHPGNETAWKAQLFFKKINFVNQQWQSVPISQIPVGLRTDKLKKGARVGQANHDAGDQESAEVDGEKKEENISWARALLGRS